jgi:hypothetical protein
MGNDEVEAPGRHQDPLIHVQSRLVLHMYILIHTTLGMGVDSFPLAGDEGGKQPGSHGTVQQKSIIQPHLLTYQLSAQQGSRWQIFRPQSVIL